MTTINLEYEIAEAFLPLYDPSRYKVLYGGRGGAKSWAIARALLDLGMRAPLRILCTREYMTSIQDSVKQLLEDQIVRLGAEWFYTVQNTTIIGKNGTTFGFEGLKRNIMGLKSYEGADICWCEEAQTISKHSWDILIPTIRKPGSEIWISFNPHMETDETYQRFVNNPPPGTTHIPVNYYDNPYFPELLRTEMEHMKRTSYDDYLNVWEGLPVTTAEGAVYKNEIREAQAGNRFTNVPYDPTQPVHTFWDLGHADSTAIWFAQTVGFEYHIIDYYENRQEPFDHYLTELQNKRYKYGTMYLPHDAKSKQLASGRSIEQLAQAAGHKTECLEKISVEIGINAARTIFPQCYFDKVRCAVGINHLKHYSYEVRAGSIARKPKHDMHSHGADAWRYLGIALKMPYKAPIKEVSYRYSGNDTGLGWMR